MLAPMPKEALSGDIMLATDDGHAHLVHSFLVQRLSPGILGAKLADARAQHGPGTLLVCVPAAEWHLVAHAWQLLVGCVFVSPDSTGRAWPRQAPPGLLAGNLVALWCGQCMHGTCWLAVGYVAMHSTHCMLVREALATCPAWLPCSLWRPSSSSHWRCDRMSTNPQDKFSSA